MKIIIFFMFIFCSLKALAGLQDSVKLLDLKENESIEGMFSSAKENLLWVKVDRSHMDQIDRRLILLDLVTGKVLSDEIVNSEVEYTTAGEYIMSTFFNDDEKIVILRTFDHKKRYTVKLEAYRTRQFLRVDEARQELLLYNLVESDTEDTPSEIEGGYDLRVIDARTMKLKDTVKFRHPLWGHGKGVFMSTDFVHFDAVYPSNPLSENPQFLKHMMINARKGEVAREFIAESLETIGFQAILDNYVIRKTQNNSGFYYSFINLIDNTESQKFLFLPLSADEDYPRGERNSFMYVSRIDDKNNVVLIGEGNLESEVRYVNLMSGEVLWKRPENVGSRRVLRVDAGIDRVCYFLDVDSNNDYPRYVCAKLSTGEVVFSIEEKDYAVSHLSLGDDFVVATRDLRNGQKKLQIYSIFDGSIRKYSTQIDEYIGMTRTSTPVWLGVVQHCIRRSKPDAGGSSFCEVYGRSLRAWSL